MLRYFNAAFWLGVDVPVLGRVPLNFIAVLGAGVLGYYQHAFWFLGLGVETAYLFSLAFSTRFQHVVDSRSVVFSQKEADQKREAIVHQLPVDSRLHLATLSRKAEQIDAIYKVQDPDEFTLGSNREAVQQMVWTYVKLLVARHTLASAGATEPGQVIMQRIAAIEVELQPMPESDPMRAPKVATLDGLKDRLAKLRQKEKAIADVDGDLLRVESQVDAILDDATKSGGSGLIPKEVSLVSQLSPGTFGESELAVADLEQSFAKGQDKPAGKPPLSQLQ